LGNGTGTAGQRPEADKDARPRKFASRGAALAADRDRANFKPAYQGGGSYAGLAYNVGYARAMLQENPGQLGLVEDYDQFHDELAKVWQHYFRPLVPGGRLVCEGGDVCLSR
jgi:hypothetical protein